MSERPLILLADDEPPVTHILGLKLRGLGMEVLTARDGEEGYASAIEHLPDVIVTDYQMPVQSGHAMAQKLADHPPTAHTPIIMLTARGHTLCPEELESTNIVRLMDKPFSANKLSRLVQEVLEDLGGAVRETTAPTTDHRKRALNAVS